MPYNKYYKQKKQVSYDEGESWEDVTPAEYQKGTLYEIDSPDCQQEAQYRWVDMDISTDWICDGTTKYYKQKKQVSNDEGRTWEDVTPPEYQKGAVYQTKSVECGYAPTGFKYYGTTSGGAVYSAECDSSMAIERYEVYSGVKTLEIGNCVEILMNCAFLGFSNLTSVIIPDSVTQIGYATFSECVNLKRVNSDVDGVCNIPSSVTGIGNAAFDRCYGFTSVIIPDSVIGWGSGAFSNCVNITSCTVGNGISRIVSFAFDGCTKLSSATIGNDVVDISDAAFRKCPLSKFNSNIEGVCNIPNNVTNIGGEAFEGNKFTSVNLPNNLKTIGQSAFSGSTFMDITIPNGTTTIGDHAFRDSINLISVTIPESVTNVGIKAFEGTPWWKRYKSDASNIFGNIIYINKIAHVATSTGITSCEFRNDTKTIGRGAFSGCKNLTGVTIINGITDILYQAFLNCSGLTGNFNIPDSVNNVEYAAFYGCSNITGVTIGSGANNINSGAFQDCAKLESISISSSNPVYDSRLNCNAIIKTSTNELVAGCKNTVIPNSVVSIGEQSFQNCFKLTSITIPNSVTNIGFSSFNGCSGLTGNLDIPNSVTTIGEFAFADCRKLTSVTIGNGVTKIGTDAFYYCTGLTSVTVNATTPPTLGEAAFQSTNNCPIYVPANSVDAYKAASGWSTYASRIQAIP